MTPQEFRRLADSTLAGKTTVSVAEVLGLLDTLYSEVDGFRSVPSAAEQLRAARAGEIVWLDAVK
jgi:hypothetical protein